MRDMTQGADIVFLALGLGGGTGSGASPVIAEEAAAAGALVMAFATLPFHFEGKPRMDQALDGLHALGEHADVLIAIPDGRVAELTDSRVSLGEAFHMSDEVLHTGIRAVADAFSNRGLIGLDIPDVCNMLRGRGRAVMGIGVSGGAERATRAAKNALTCPLLDHTDISRAFCVIISVRGGSDLLMREVSEVHAQVTSSVERNTRIIIGTIVEDEERSEIEVVIIAVGIRPPDEDSAYSAEYRGL